MESNRAHIALVVTCFVASASIQGTHVAAAANLSSEGIVELQTDWGIAADTDDAEYVNTSATIEIVTEWQFSPAVSVIGGIVLEPVADSDGDSFLEHEGLYVSDLYSLYQAQFYSLQAGKYGARFGTAWDITPGIYGTEFAEDYEIAETLGFGADLSLGTLLGWENSSLVLSGDVFTFDRSVLSDSAFTNRGRLKLTDGGVGNTELPESYSLSLEGEVSTAGPNLLYHIAFRNLASDKLGLPDEKGLAVGGAYAFATGSVETAVNLEHAIFDDVGFDRETMRYTTLGITTTIDDWALSFTTARRSNFSHQHDHAIQLSIGRTVLENLEVALAFKEERVDGDTIKTIGLLVSVPFSFNGQ